ncbi:MAG: hypothetical protein R3E12_13810 [Candidatus Eisenbacteria bacterium]
MSEFPHSALSDHFQERMRGRRLLGAVFTTFRFDPAFFEQEVLPILFDVTFSHIPRIRTMQLEQELRTVPNRIAVYYDVHGLSGDAESATLDYLRVPVRHPRGIFHPKNVFLLVESIPEDEESIPETSLIAACLSANLTRSGWWENVEVAHVEEIREGDRSRVKDELRRFLRRIRRATPHSDHTSLKQVSRFLRSVRQRQQRSSGRSLHTHFFGGRGTIVDFLERVARRKLPRMYLEIISPYFDDAPHCKPLESLIERFDPKEVRIHLPTDRTGTATLREDLFESVSALPGVTWGHLPADFLRLGAGKDAGERLVHAKVYRFFSQNPKREILFVGSANLTTPAHKANGNVESGFLVEVRPRRRPDFWLSADTPAPSAFLERSPAEDSAATGGTALMLRFHWDRSEAEVFWDQDSPSPALEIKARGLDICALTDLPSRTWQNLDTETAQRIAEVLPETSLFWVHSASTENPGLLLVQEEGMSHRPSLFLRLTPAEILEYWSLLTPDQRAQFLEEHAPPSLLLGLGADLTIAAPLVHKRDTIFDRFAGYFHAFSLLESSIRKSLDDGNHRDANYRLFGQKYDSLGNFLGRLSSEGDAAGDSSPPVPAGSSVSATTSNPAAEDSQAAAGPEQMDPVDRYVIVLCARQLYRQISREYPDYWSEHREDVRRLDAEFDRLGQVRADIIASDPDSLSEFLAWFESRFLPRAHPVAENGAIR